MKTMYEFLMAFTNGDYVCRNHLIKHYGKELFEEALEKKYIAEVGKTDIGDPQYYITELGKSMR